MTHFCCQCLKSFESDRVRTFCTPACREAFNWDVVARRRHVRATARQGTTTISGHTVGGGRQAVNRQNSDGRYND